MQAESAMDEQNRKTVKPGHSCLVLQCRCCNSIVADNRQQVIVFARKPKVPEEFKTPRPMVEEEDDEPQVLADTHYLSWSEDFRFYILPDKLPTFLLSSKPNFAKDERYSDEDEGSCYMKIVCADCAHVIGKFYLATSQPNAHRRDRYCLWKDAISLYSFDVPGLQPNCAKVVNRGTKLEEIPPVSKVVERADARDVIQQREMKAAMDKCLDKTIEIDSSKEYRFTEAKKKREDVTFTGKPLFLSPIERPEDPMGEFEDEDLFQAFRLLRGKSMKEEAKERSTKKNLKFNDLTPTRDVSNKENQMSDWSEEPLRLQDLNTPTA